MVLWIGLTKSSKTMAVQCSCERKPVLPQFPHLQSTGRSSVSLPACVAHGRLGPGSLHGGMQIVSRSGLWHSAEAPRYESPFALGRHCTDQAPMASSSSGLAE